jgi:adenine phosphoribosyltransferase
MDIKEILNNSIRTIPDFPKKGIMFKDITTLLNDKDAFKSLIDFLKERYQDKNIDFIAGIESRGFIFGSALSYTLNVGFVPIRKKGKLPYTTIAEKYALEYGFDEVEIHIDAFRDIKNPKVLLIDDLIATGGTAKAAENLIKKAGGELVESCFIIELEFLEGAKKLESPIFSILKEKD